MFQMLVEFVLSVVILIFVFTQIAYPLIRGRALFPLFRKDLGKAEDLLEEAKAQRDVEEVLEKVQKTHKHSTKG